MRPAGQLPRPRGPAPTATRLQVPTPTSHAPPPQRQMLRTLGLIAAANFAVFLVGLFLPRRYIVRPVLGVETAARRIEAGDFPLRLDVSTHDELGTLAQTFNRMTEHVQRLLDALDLRRKHAETG